MAVTIDASSRSDGNKYRDLQLNNVPRVKGLEIFTHKWDVSIKAFPIALRDLCRRGGRRLLRADRSGRHRRKKVF